MKRETLLDLHTAQVIKSAVEWATRMHRSACAMAGKSKPGMCRKHFEADAEAYCWLIDKIKFAPHLKILKRALMDIEQAEKHGTSGAIAKAALDACGVGQLGGWKA